jgi:hypothetical protein
MGSTHYRGVQEKERKKVCQTNSDIHSYNSTARAPMELARRSECGE